jgi:hypothetical protein
VEAKMPVREVVKRRDITILHGLADEADEAPRASFPIGPHGIEGLPDVRTVTQ